MPFFGMAVAVADLPEHGNVPNQKAFLPPFGDFEQYRPIGPLAPSTVVHRFVFRADKDIEGKDSSFG
jgi:hypothetical protein